MAGLDDLLIVPRDVLQRAYDELERVEDCWRLGTETYILHHQIDMILRPDPAHIAPSPKMASDFMEPGGVSSILAANARGER